MAEGKHRGEPLPYQRRDMWQAMWDNPREPMVVLLVVAAAAFGSVALLARGGAAWWAAGLALAVLGLVLLVAYAAEFTPWLAAGAASENPRSRRRALFLRVFWRGVATLVVLALCIAWLVELVAG